MQEFNRFLSESKPLTDLSTDQWFVSNRLDAPENLVYGSTLDELHLRVLSVVNNTLVAAGKRAGDYGSVYQHYQFQSIGADVSGPGSVDPRYSALLKVLVPAEAAA